MIKYKLTNQRMQTFRGFQWSLLKKEVISAKGNKMCSEEVFHGYHSPEQAVIFNPIHACFENSRLFEVEVDQIVSDDGLKFGCKEMTLVRELPIPKITVEQKVAFAIKAVLKVYSEPGFISWAEKWLSGEDRSTEAADRAAAWSADRAAARAAAWSAWSAARYADRYAAEFAAVRAAVRAAEAAAWAARAAAETAEAAGLVIDFQQIIEEVING